MSTLIMNRTNYLRSYSNGEDERYKQFGCTLPGLKLDSFEREGTNRMRISHIAYIHDFFGVVEDSAIDYASKQSK